MGIGEEENERKNRKNFTEIASYAGEHMLTEGIISSFQLIELVANLEDEFDIDIDPDYIMEEYFGNTNKIIALVERIMGLH